MTSAWFWHSLGYLNLCPLFSLWVKLIQITNIDLVSTPKYVNQIIVHASGVTPSGWGNARTFFEIEFFADDKWVFSIRCDKIIEVENVNVVHMHIFTVTSAECNHSVFTYWSGCVKAFGVKSIWVVKLKLSPDTKFEIQCPNILQIRTRGFTPRNNHVFVDQTGSMICSWLRHSLTWNMH